MGLGSNPTLGEIFYPDGGVLMRFRSGVAGVAVAVSAYLLLWPVDFRPEAWTPPPLPDDPVYSDRQRLQGIERLAEGLGVGPEGLSVDADGRLYTAYLDGRVVALSPQGELLREIANTGGRPLGLVHAGDGTLYVADGRLGLVRVATDGAVTVLSDGAQGRPFRFVDDVDISGDGTRLFFSDASWRYDVNHADDDVMENAPNGRLLQYDIASGRTTVVLDDLYFPNGVAVGPDDAYVLVNETARFRVTRLWLKGPSAGNSEVFAANQPGMPDNISFNGEGYWVALYAPRMAALDVLLPYPWLRKVVYRLPKFLMPAPPRHGWIVALDLQGRVVDSLQYAGSGAYAPITSVEQTPGALYFGSVKDTAIGRLPWHR